MKKFLVIALSTILLSGCKVDMSTSINTDDLLSNQHKLISGNLSIEVPSCNDFEDSRKDSKTLADLKSKIPTVFTKAEFKECYKQKFNSFASFEIPIGVGSFREDNQLVDAEVYIFSTNDMYIGALMDKGTVSRMDSLKKTMPANLDLELTLNIVKGKQPIPKTLLMGAYVTNANVNNVPAIMNLLTIGPDGAKLKLSDVSNSLLTSGRPTPVLVTSSYLKDFLSSLEK